MTIIERIRELPYALEHAYLAWRQYWWLAHGYRNPDEVPF